MIAELKPYAKYKNSDSRWLERVPSHWGAIPLGRLLIQRVEQNRPVKTKDILSLSLRQGVIPYSEKKSGGNKAKNDLSAYTLAYPDDIVLNSMNVVVGSVGLSKYFGAVSPVYYVLHRRDTNDSIHYFDALFQDRTFQQSLWGLGNGILFLQSKTTGKFNTIRMRIPMHALRRVVVPHPSPEEQAAIVRFLDWANGRLDQAIRAKRKVIALLKEQKQAIIHRTVTRGLDSAVPLKSSGIPWLGDIPQHWEVRQLRHMGRLHKGVGGSKEDATPEGVPCVRYGELYFHYRNFIRQPRGFVSVDKAAGYTPLRFGDVLFAASGERVEEIGKSAVNLYGGTAVCGGDVVIFRPTVVVHAAFLGYALDSYGAAHQKATMCRGTTIKHIYPDELRGLWFCVPPLSEQERIAVKLDNELLDSNNAMSRLEREIELLREYRTRLVADVVTGKLDVREAASRLPVEAPLDTIEDDADSGDEAEAADEDTVA